MGTTVQYHNQNCVKVLSRPLFLYILSYRFKIQIPKEPLPENVACHVVIKKKNCHTKYCLSNRFESSSIYFVSCSSLFCHHFWLPQHTQ